jgi:outer membrane protein assembly factor BamA
VLKTKLRTKTRKFFFFGGKYDPSSIDDDIAALRSYYTGLGFFDIDIKKRVGHSPDTSKVYIEYSVSEGPRYRIRSIEIEGTSVISESVIRKDLITKAGDDFTSLTLTKDIDEIQAKYGELGRINASVTAIPQFLPDVPGVMDLKLQIDEDEVWRIRRINVHITGAGGQPTPHTREAVIRNYATVFPGELANPREIKRSKQRINRNQLFEAGPTNAPRIEFNPVPEEETRLAQSLMFGDNTVRGQSGDDDSEVRAQNFDANGQPIPGTPLWDNNPGGDPFGPQLYGAPPPFIEYREGDLDIYVEEARTGRLMFGVGVNSDSGVVGNIVLDERNFDIFRPPTSFDDILEGRAWRGGGQSFRLEAVPGTIVSRYSVNWTDPYFLNTDNSLSLSGFYYNRFFDDWDESRSGGRIGIGRQITPELSVNASLRLEEVKIDNPRGAPPPDDLLDVEGSNFFSSARFTVSHDTRDSAFMPGEGHNVVGSFEQAFGEFLYPRVELNASQYFTVYNRIDGQGRHILSVNGNAGWTDTGTPIFERFYAGGFSSFRGFEFRGVTPIEGTVETGGNFQLLGSVQYQFPVLADESLQLVAFTDFGTVDEDVTLDNFRVSVGGGIRLQIPAMGPVPLAFDWAVPVVREDFDQRQLFSFYVGINR